jgi:translation initiation factor IF-3
LVVGESGEQVGTMPTGKALEMARDRGLDLVEVAPSARPPVCRILDYGKLRYLSSKKEREAKKSQRSTGRREVRFRPKIGEHDFSSKVRKVKQLIGDGAKVKVAVVFRGREVTHPERGMSLLKRVAELVQEEARLEGPPGMEGRSVSMMLAPTAKKVVRKAEPVANAQAQDA